MGTLCLCYCPIISSKFISSGCSPGKYAAMPASFRSLTSRFERSKIMGGIALGYYTSCIEM